jgi:hypothetical protein
MSAPGEACPATNIGLLRQARDRLDLNRWRPPVIDLRGGGRGDLPCAG